MYKCYADSMGNMPCDNGTLCDKCVYMDVEIINNYLYPDNWEMCDDVEEWEENILNDIDALNDIFNYISSKHEPIEETWNEEYLLELKALNEILNIK